MTLINIRILLYLYMIHKSKSSFLDLFYRNVSRDVIFDESTFWQWNDVVEADHNQNQFTLKYLITEPEEGGAQHQEPSPPPAGAPPEPVEFTTPQRPNVRRRCECCTQTEAENLPQQVSVSTATSSEYNGT